MLSVSVGFRGGGFSRTGPVDFPTREDHKGV